MVIPLARSQPAQGPGRSLAFVSKQEHLDVTGSVRVSYANVVILE